jgi:hypothetical protein
MHSGEWPQLLGSMPDIIGLWSGIEAGEPSEYAVRMCDQWFRGRLELQEHINGLAK